jgi:hypothetical protein
VARRRPPRAMRPHRAVRIARVTVPAARVTPLAGVTGANTPADDARAAYPAAFGLKPDTIRIHRAVCRRYPQVKTPCFLCALGGRPRRRSCSRLHDLWLHGRLGHREMGRQRQELGRERDHPAAAPLATKFRGLASDVGPQFTDCQSDDHLHGVVYGDSGTV